MSTQSSSRRRSAVHITLQRAARLHRLVRFLAGAARARPAILSELRVGLRTFYRELELLKKCGVSVRHKQKRYHLLPTGSEALGRLPFPDPQLSFAEMAELAACLCGAGRRLSELLDAVVNDPGPAKTRGRKSKPDKQPRSGG